MVRSQNPFSSRGWVSVYRHQFEEVRGPLGISSVTYVCSERIVSSEEAKAWSNPALRLPVTA